MIGREVSEKQTSRERNIIHTQVTLLLKWENLINYGYEENNKFSLIWCSRYDFNIVRSNNSDETEDRE
jgi:hypothetical protein